MIANRYVYFSCLSLSLAMLLLLTTPVSAQQVKRQFSWERGAPKSYRTVSDQPLRNTQNSPAATSSWHPAWVTDLESKMWPGFLTGLPGYEDFVMPVGFFMYFEDPFITTDLRLIYVYHGIPDGSALRGGQVHAIAAQIRVALTEKLVFIPTMVIAGWIRISLELATDGMTSRWV